MRFKFTIDQLKMAKSGAERSEDYESMGLIQKDIDEKEYILAQLKEVSKSSLRHYNVKGIDHDKLLDESIIDSGTTWDEVVTAIQETLDTTDKTLEDLLHMVSDIFMSDKDDKDMFLEKKRTNNVGVVDASLIMDLVVRQLEIILSVNFMVVIVDKTKLAIVASNREQLMAVVSKYDLNILEENQKLLTIEALLTPTFNTLSRL